MGAGRKRGILEMEEDGKSEGSSGRRRMLRMEKLGRRGWPERETVESME